MASSKRMRQHSITTSSDCPVKKRKLVKPQISRDREERAGKSTRKGKERNRCSSRQKDRGSPEKLWLVWNIIDERANKYLIDWADDPKTGEKFSPSWIPKRDANREAVIDWEQSKEADIASSLYTTAAKINTSTPKRDLRKRGKPVSYIEASQEFLQSAPDYQLSKLQDSQERIQFNLASETRNLDTFSVQIRDQPNFNKDLYEVFSSSESVPNSAHSKYPRSPRPHFPESVVEVSASPPKSRRNQKGPLVFDPNAVVPDSQGFSSLWTSSSASASFRLQNRNTDVSPHTADAILSVVETVNSTNPESNLEGESGSFHKKGGGKSRLFSPSSSHKRSLYLPSQPVTLPLPPRDTSPLGQLVTAQPNPQLGLSSDIDLNSQSSWTGAIKPLSAFETADWKETSGEPLEVNIEAEIILDGGDEKGATLSPEEPHISLSRNSSPVGEPPRLPLGNPVILKAPDIFRPLFVSSETDRNTTEPQHQIRNSPSSIEQITIASDPVLSPSRPKIKNLASAIPIYTDTSDLSVQETSGQNQHGSAQATGGAEEEIWQAGQSVLKLNNPESQTSIPDTETFNFNKKIEENHTSTSNLHSPIITSGNHKSLTPRSSRSSSLSPTSSPSLEPPNAENIKASAILDQPFFTPCTNPISSKSISAQPLQESSDKERPQFSDADTDTPPHYRSLQSSHCKQKLSQLDLRVSFHQALAFEPAKTPHTSEQIFPSVEIDSSLYIQNPLDSALLGSPIPHYPSSLLNPAGSPNPDLYFQANCTMSNARAAPSGLTLKEKLKNVRSASLASRQSSVPSISTQFHIPPITASGSKPSPDIVSIPTRQHPFSPQGLQQPISSSSSQLISSSYHLMAASAGAVLPFQQGKREFFVALRMNAIVRDQYQQVIYNYRDQIVALTATEKPESHLKEQMRGMLSVLFNVSVHPDLENAAVAKQKEVPEAAEAQWAEMCSAKFLFLNNLLRSVRSCDIHVVIMSRMGRTMDILETVLKGKKLVYSRPDKYTRSPDAYQSKLKITLLPTGASGADFLISNANLVISLDTSFNREDRQVVKIREDLVSQGLLCPVLHLVIPNSVEHAALCLPPTLDATATLQVLVSYSAQKRSEAGVLPSEYPMPEAAATQVANYVFSGFDDTKWTLPILHGISTTDIFSETRASETPAPEPLGSNTTGAKRPMVEERNSNAASKKQCLTPAPADQTSSMDLDVTHISDLMANPSSNEQPRSQPEANLTSLPENPKTSELEAEIVQLRSKNEELTKHAAELTEKLKSEKLNVHDHVTALNDLQYRYEELRQDIIAAKQDRKASIDSATEAFRRREAYSLRISTLNNEKTELTNQLKEARQALSSSSIPEVAELENVRANLRKALADVARLEKKLTSTNNDFEFTRSQYQIASTAAAESARELVTVQEENEALVEKAKGEELKVLKYKEQRETQQLRDTVEYLRQDLAKKDEMLRKKDEQLLMFGGVMTRSMSVPRSPRGGSRANSRANSRASSPLPSAFSDNTNAGNGSVKVGHPLRNF
ncbi:MAG: hypothetical protein M1829_006542 [Trizodia sp. TS-e1964]|nr:MAG: hypothetical protein M1829_006542 [Trizodia sp. TS-e1964]